MTRSSNPKLGVRVSRLAHDGEELLVLSWDASTARALEGLSKTEREIARAVVNGVSTRHIALSRGTAERTVANQIAAVYRKLGVHSRAELVARLSR